MLLSKELSIVFVKECDGYESRPIGVVPEQGTRFEEDADVSKWPKNLVDGSEIVEESRP